MDCSASTIMIDTSQNCTFYDKATVQQPNSKMFSPSNVPATQHTISQIKNSCHTCFIVIDGPCTQTVLQQKETKSILVIGPVYNTKKKLDTKVPSFGNNYCTLSYRDCTSNVYYHNEGNHGDRLTSPPPPVAAADSASS